VMGTGFKTDKCGGATRLSPGISQCHDFRVVSTSCTVPTLGYNLAVMHKHTADSRVRRSS